MLPLRLPRRFRRRLLLPPGWVALGSLLLLGCLLLRAQERRLRPANIVQLNLPRYHPTVQQLAFYRLGSDGRAEYSPFTDTGGAQATAHLAQLRPWRSFALRGQPTADSLQLLAAETAVQTIQADTSHAGGIRVRLSAGVTYRKLIALLDMVNRRQVSRYWLDTRRRPTTLYIITPKYIRHEDEKCPLFYCINCQESRKLPPTLSQYLASLRQPERRPQLLLTLAIASLLLASLAGTQVVARLLVA